MVSSKVRRRHLSGFNAVPYLPLAALTLTLTQQPLYAQQDNRLTAIEEIIVTARKTEESIQEAPISIAAFSTADLEKIGAFEAGAISRYTSNVQIRKQTASQDNYAYSIRGVDSGETSLAVEPTVGLYMDGVYIARSTGAAFDIVDLERIEVLRGPQGTLFGRNTIGGAINVIAEKPLGEWAFKQQVSFGNREYLRSQTTIDTPAFGDFAFKFSHMYTEKGGTNTSIYTGGELGQQEAEAFRFAARWTPNVDMTIDYTYDKSDRENNGNTDQLSHVRDQAFLGGSVSLQAFGAQNTKRISQLYSANDAGGESTSDIDGHALTFEWEATPDMTFKSITSYREWKSVASGTDFGSFPTAPNETFIPIPNFVTPGLSTAVPIAAGELVSLFAATRDSAQRQFTQEFQLVGDAMDENLHYNVGIYYFEEKANEDNPQEFTLPGPFGWGALAPNLIALLGPNPTPAALGQRFAETAQLCGPGFTGATRDLGNGFVVPANCVGRDLHLFAPVFIYSTENESIALYGEFTYSFTDQLDITLGLRYTEDDKLTRLQTSVFDAEDSESWENFSPSITFDYQVNDEVSSYFKVSNGYRAGGYNARSTTETSFRDSVDEETLLSYELGMKSDWLDRTLRVNAAVFFFEYDDLQVAQFEAGSGGASSKIVNAGKSETFGLELDITWLPVAGLMVMANYGYVDEEFKEYNTPFVDPILGATDRAGGNVDIADIAFRESPANHEGSLIVEYQFEPTDYGQLSVRIDSTWVDERAFHPQLNRFDTSDDYNLLNARATLTDIPAGRDGRLKIAAWGKNLENKEYREWGIDFGSLGFAINTYGELRSYGIDVIYEFNR